MPSQLKAMPYTHRSEGAFVRVTSFGKVVAAVISMSVYYELQFPNTIKQGNYIAKYKPLHALTSCVV